MGVVGPQSLSIMRVEMVGHDLGTRSNVDAITAPFASLAAVSALEQGTNQAPFVPLAMVQHCVSFAAAIDFADLFAAINARKLNCPGKLDSCLVTSGCQLVAAAHLAATTTHLRAFDVAAFFARWATEINHSRSISAVNVPAVLNSSVAVS
jgi:hypothetical protein